jgi:hypothetical protein
MSAQAVREGTVDKEVFMVVPGVPGRALLSISISL